MFTPEKRMHPDRAHAFTKAQTSRDGQLQSQGKTKIKEWMYAPGCVVCVLRNSCCYLNFNFCYIPKDAVANPDSAAPYLLHSYMCDCLFIFKCNLFPHFVIFIIYSETNPK